LYEKTTPAYPGIRAVERVVAVVVFVVGRWWSS